MQDSPPHRHHHHKSLPQFDTILSQCSQCSVQSWFFAQTVSLPFSQTAQSLSDYVLIPALLSASIYSA